MTHNIPLSFSGNPEDISSGWKALSKGIMGAVVLAGGMGTRLGFDRAKGLFPITPVQNKTLFQYLAEKCFYASKEAGVSLPLAIMTSPENDLETREYFQQNNFFGLSSDQISFFVQGEQFMDDLEGTQTSYKAADGNGGVFSRFVECGLFEEWSKKGVEHINILLIDNPLADPYDVNLLGHHLRVKSDVTVKCIPRRSLSEKVGILIQNQSGLSVVEYSEIDLQERDALLSEGTLKHPYANLSLFCISLPFVKQLSCIKLPIHLIKKPLTKKPGAPLGWKKETYIFDLLPFSKNPSLLVYKREETFAPLKNQTGEDSPNTVKVLLSARDCDIISNLSGERVEIFPFELSPRYHYMKQLVDPSAKPNDSYMS